jgi:hypothetical protein
MPEDLADSAAQLQRLLKQIMKEKDPLKCHELGAEIWRVLDERNRLRRALVIHKRPHPKWCVEPLINNVEMTRCLGDSAISHRALWLESQKASRACAILSKIEHAERDFMGKASLITAVGKLAMTGEQAGFSLEQMIDLLNDGISVETLLDLISWRLGQKPLSSPVSSWVM